jgi:superfamily I DNA/RNA helicase
VRSRRNSSSRCPTVAPRIACFNCFGGQSPVIKGFTSEQEEADWVVDYIRQLVEAGAPSQDICVVGRTASQLKAVTGALERSDITSIRISHNKADNPDVPGVRLANMHRIKGLEFRAVFLVGIRRTIVPLELAISGTEDKVERRIRELTERALLHVAGSRAMHSLYVTWSGEPSRFLKGLAEA